MAKNDVVDQLEKVRSENEELRCPTVTPVANQHGPEAEKGSSLTSPAGRKGLIRMNMLN